MYVNLGLAGMTTGRSPAAGRTGGGGRGSPGVRANRRKLRDGKAMGTKVPKNPEMGPPRKPSEAVFVGRGEARERAEFSPSGGNGAERTLLRRGAMSARLLELRQRTRKGDGAKHGS